MKNSFQMYIEYEIKQEVYDQYVALMSKVIETLPQYDANKIQWSSSQDKENYFIESFILPTESHFHVMKRLRKTRSHLLFGLLDDCICGGVKEIKCFGLKTNHY